MLAGPGDFKGDPANMLPRDRKKQLVTQTEGVSLQNTFLVGSALTWGWSAPSWPLARRAPAGAALAAGTHQAQSVDDNGASRLVWDDKSCTGQEKLREKWRIRQRRP